MAINLTFNRIVLVKEKTSCYDIPRFITSPHDASQAIRTVFHLQEESQEVFGAIFLDTKNKIIGIHQISKGSIHASIASSRDVFKIALLHNASSIILFHNHPSGNPHPSDNDRQVTNNMKSAGKLLEIQVLDHIIIGDDTFFSFQSESIL